MAMYEAYSVEGLPHGPFEPILRSTNPLITDYIDRHIDVPLEYAQSDDEKITLLESRWAADQLGEAILEQYDKGAMPLEQMLFMSRLLERWYFWPLDDAEQQRTTQELNQAVLNYKSKAPSA